MLEINKIYNEDCLIIMSKMEDKSIDLVLIDPPYGINQAIWDKLNNNYIKECYRILKNSGSIWVFAGWSNVLEVRTELQKYFIERNWIIWDRIKGRGAKYNFISTREDILWFSKSDKYTFNKQSSTIKKKTGGMGLKNGDSFRKLSNVWTDISPIVPWSKEKCNHPTQKPIKLIERILNVSSNEGNLIFDGFVGSGTTAVACKNLKRNFIVCDISKNYCKIGDQRLKDKKIFSLCNISHDRSITNNIIEEGAFNEENLKIMQEIRNGKVN
jgi:site-specific DNA-methyltransferase (adenine-specific)